jgi:hypothetical protein
MQGIRYWGLVCLLCFSASLFARETLIPKQQSQKKIVLNQLGYLPHIKKEALLISDVDAPKERWQLIDIKTQKVVASGELAAAQKDQHTPFYVQAINFSYINKKGRYRLKVDEI